VLVPGGAARLNPILNRAPRWESRSEEPQREEQRAAEAMSNPNAAKAFWPRPFLDPRNAPAEHTVLQVTNPRISASTTRRATTRWTPGLDPQRDPRKKQHDVVLAGVKAKPYRVAYGQP
jgi:hypothetical protein